MVHNISPTFPISLKIQAVPFPETKKLPVPGGPGEGRELLIWRREFHSSIESMGRTVYLPTNLP